MLMLAFIHVCGCLEIEASFGLQINLHYTLFICRSHHIFFVQ